MSSLPGAYYGPPIPAQPNHIPRRKCRHSLVSILIKSIMALCLVLGITALALWLVYRPNKIKVNVESASLTRFNLAPDHNSIYFDIVSNITLRNPNKKIGVYYDWLEAQFYYDGSAFCWGTMTPFYQGRKNTTMLNLTYGGRLSLGNGDAKFKHDNSTGLFDVDIWLYSRLRYKFGSSITRNSNVHVKCALALRLVANETEKNQFKSTKCDVDF